MKFPWKAEFNGDRNAHALAMTAWLNASQDAYRHFRGLYDATEVSPAKPKWLTGFVPGGETTIRNVSTDHPPDSEENLEIRLNALSQIVMETGLDIVNLCHGVFDGEWSCFVELKAK